MAEIQRVSSALNMQDYREVVYVNLRESKQIALYTDKGVNAFFQTQHMHSVSRSGQMSQSELLLLHQRALQFTHMFCISVNNV